MHLLLVSYYWPPDVNARALRWSSVTAAWLAAGHQVTVVTRGQAGQPAREQEGALTVIRAGGAGGARLRAAVGGAASQGGFRALVGGAVRAVYRATWRRIYWPDFAGPWYWPAARAVRQALGGSAPPDALVTVSHPFTPHLVGHAARRASPDLPWIADCGDPFSLFEDIPLNNAALYRGLNRRAEARVLARADAVALTVEACRDLYVEAFPDSAAKFTVVPPVAAMPVTEGAPAPLTAFAFFGRFYRGLRNPSGMLALLAGLAERGREVTLDIYGDLNDCADLIEAPPAALTGRVRFHGLLDPAHAAEAMARAGVLVNIGNTTPFQLPSKIFEYAATGRPILNLAQIDSDSSARFLADYPAALTTRDGGASVNVLADWLSQVAPVPAPAVSALLAPHRPAAVAQTYLDLLPVKGAAAST